MTRDHFGKRSRQCRNEFGSRPLEPPFSPVEYPLVSRMGALDRANDGDRKVYLVLEDLGRYDAFGAKPMRRPRVSNITDLLTGQYTDLIRVIGWSEGVSADVAQELRRRCGLQMRDIPLPLQDFTDRDEGRYRDIQLPLPIRLA